VVSASRRFYGAAAAIARGVPLAVAVPLAEHAGGPLAECMWPGQRDQLARNLHRVCPELDDRQLAELTRRALGSYTRYWAESFKLPHLSPRAIDDGFSFEGLEHIVEAREAGIGPIVVLPHLGGWEWAAAWLARVVQVPVTAVVEALRPPDLFEWFVELRSSIGINVVPLGPHAASAVARAVRDRHVVCLVADRDLTGTGVPVTFFGEQTTLPAGPALLSRRLGAPVLPTAVYFRRHDRFCTVGRPLDVAPRGTMRDDLARITQDIAWAFEDLIRAAPEQWHLLTPNWPSDVQRAADAAATTDGHGKAGLRPPSGLA
jgi:phosphatidylinositol dimannoside acyltransferase